MDLTYGNVDYQNKILKFEQNKTCQFFLLIENKKLTKIISLTGNDLESKRLRDDVLCRGCIVASFAEKRYA